VRARTDGYGTRAGLVAKPVDGVHAIGQVWAGGSETECYPLPRAGTMRPPKNAARAIASCLAVYIFRMAAVEAVAARLRSSGHWNTLQSYVRSSRLPCPASL
jgi:hypothetical protein